MFLLDQITNLCLDFLTKDSNKLIISPFIFKRAYKLKFSKIDKIFSYGFKF